MLAVCAFGCRQVDTLGPGGDSLSVHRPRSLPAVAPRTSSAQVVEVCRIPTRRSRRRTRSAAPREADDRPDAIARSIAISPKPWAPCNLSRAASASHCRRTSATPPRALRSWRRDSPDLTEPASRFQPAKRKTAVSSRGAARSWQRRATTSSKTTANYYTRGTLGEFIVILAPAAVFANSDFDADVGDWYQQHVRSNATNRAADFFRPLGNGYYTIPAYVSAKFLGEYFDDQPGMAAVGRIRRSHHAGAAGGRSAPVGRAIPDRRRTAVEHRRTNSYWRPFHDSNGASGHAFMGAVPFLTLAGMTDDPLAKCFFYACSPWTGVSRINDNLHYLSQVWLGWWMAYLACDAVNKTETEKGPLLITPLCTPEMTGVGLVYQH